MMSRLFNVLNGFSVHHVILGNEKTVIQENETWKNWLLHRNLLTMVQIGIDYNFSTEILREE